ncbi:MAG: methyltransferase domain-containing protein [Bryobacterales bacterium]|nr:methyltransferase domain-containing protein [Bryobacterales bacterium]
MLDAGCGLGYGTASLGADATLAVGLDSDFPTVQAAAAAYANTTTQFLVADVRLLPFRETTFDCSVSFEVIEHLHEPARLLEALHDVTKPSGIVFISTPNKDVYDVSRGDAGPNPFHHHEFRLEEFLELLRRHFAHVLLFAQNHTPCVSFRQALSNSGLGAQTSLPSETVDAEDAQFFVAVCSQQRMTEVEDFVYIASGGNVLFEREKHIGLLTDELRLKNDWLNKTQDELKTLHEAHQQVHFDLEQKISWAQKTSVELDTAVTLLHNTEALLLERTTWAMNTIKDLENKSTELAEELESKCAELGKAVDQLHHTEEVLSERSHWALTTIGELEGVNKNLAEKLNEKCDELQQAVTRQHFLEEQLQTAEVELVQLYGAIETHASRANSLALELDRVAWERNVLRNSTVVKLAQRLGLLRSSRESAESK